jgi:diguanylate cyclase (GGDEF)-like protein
MQTHAMGSDVDELTGLNGRRQFFELALAAFEKARDAGEEITAIVIDLDRLAFVNDKYGHHAGTELIRETGAALEAIAEEGDIVGRLGGDEFAMLRPHGIASRDALWVQISTAAKRASRSDQPFGLEVSVGVASARADIIASLDALMAQADDAMYEHKQDRGGTEGPPHARRSSRD